jgi:hypothetical protein
MGQKFKISANLKDIIGRNLIPNDHVALFELAKNSFEAHATSIEIEIDDDFIMKVDDDADSKRTESSHSPRRSDWHPRALSPTLSVISWPTLRVGMSTTASSQYRPA